MGGVDISSTFGEDFLDELKKTNSKYYSDLFDGLFNDNDKLKVSECKYSSSGKKIDCQTWCGNSGCGIFDDKGNLMGINTRGTSVIGGTSHAGDNITSKKTATIPIAF